MRSSRVMQTDGGRLTRGVILVATKMDPSGRVQCQVIEQVRIVMGVVPARLPYGSHR